MNMIKSMTIITLYCLFGLYIGLTNINWFKENMNNSSRLCIADKSSFECLADKLFMYFLWIITSIFMGPPCYSLFMINEYVSIHYPQMYETFIENF